MSSAPSNTAAQSLALAATAGRETTAHDVKPTTDTYTVARRDTLNRIAGIAGAHSRSDRRRMMIAIFRANPGAFQTNLNNLRSGATLHLPSMAELAKIPADDANREFAAQMAAWRSSDHHVSAVAKPSAGASSAASSPVERPSTAANLAASPSVARPSVAATPAASPSVARPSVGANSAARPAAASTLAPVSANSIADVQADIEAHKAETIALTQRIATLEKSLDEVRAKLQHPPVGQRQPAVESAPVAQSSSVVESTPVAQSSSVAGSTTVAQSTSVSESTPAVKSAPAVESTPASVAATEQFADDTAAEDEPAPAPRHRNWLVTLAIRVGLVFAAGIALALVSIAGVWLYRRRRRDDDESFVGPDFATEEPVRRDPDSYREAAADDTPIPFSKVDISASYLVEELAHDAEHAGADAGAIAIAGASVSADATDSPVALDAAAVIEKLKASGAPQSPAPSVPTPRLEPAGNARGGSLPTPDPTLKLAIDPTVKLPTPRGGTAETTAVLGLHPDLTLDDTAAREFAFFNPESTLNTTHVMMSGDSAETKPFVERRKNPADVLRQAIEREPERSDLRLKLLELYYTAAAQNRRAFLENVRQLAKNDKLLASAKDWSQIEDMGRVIAPDDELFSHGAGDDKKAVA
jgi:FimV-like protein